MRNPQIFKQYQNLKQSNGDPKQMINEILGGYTPEQISQFKQYANGFGITNEQLENFGINTK